MIRILASIVLLSLFLHGKAQLHHSCPVHPTDGSYINPLYDQWLSAYDIIHYRLSLEVRNTDTQVEGIAEVYLEAVRELDTLVLELQDGLEVSEIFYSDLAEPEYPVENAVEFQHVDNALYIILDRTRNAGELLWVKIALAWLKVLNPS